jgi:squalene-hopene/tetraprenyl-beta-curcumene cyclase
MGEDQLIDDAGVNHSWRRELLEKLAELQAEDGSWSNKSSRWLEGDANLSTGYALLALSYCRPK